MFPGSLSSAWLFAFFSLCGLSVSLNPRLVCPAVSTASALLTTIDAAAPSLGLSKLSEWCLEPTTAKTGSKAERTCALIKPDAFAAGYKDAIVERILAEGFKIVNSKDLMLTTKQAEEFYEEHQARSFYRELVEWMSTPDQPIHAMVLERENAVKAWRELAGPTNSANARKVAPQSIRALYGTDSSKNAVHGSDSLESAQREIRIIFGDTHHVHVQNF